VRALYAGRSFIASEKRPAGKESIVLLYGYCIPNAMLPKTIEVRRVRPQRVGYQCLGTKVDGSFIGQTGKKYENSLDWRSGRLSRPCRSYAQTGEKESLRSHVRNESIVVWLPFDVLE
jgi:hypothetical protein